jgi:phosphoglycerate dehydrogenase-like enzyme
MPPRQHPFRVGWTADFFETDGRPKFPDVGQDAWAGAGHVTSRRLTEHRPYVEPDQLADCDAVIVLTPRVDARSLAAADGLLAIGRFGVGYDTVDVAACTERDVLVTITSGAVDRPVAEATVGWMIALSHHMLVKDRLVRTGRWEERSRYMGRELRDRTLGVIGLGGIGRTLVQLLAGFGMRPPLAYDPLLPRQAFADLGVQAVGLDELLAESDFVSLHCPLNERTRGLIGREQLARMRPDAWLINTSRGGLVDEHALREALESGRLAGAALDCFEQEPVTGPSGFAHLDNVLLAPHSIAWTAELFRDIGRTACRSMMDLSLGRRPHGVLNPELFDRERFRAKWARLTGLPREQLACRGDVS